jgi:hypothetical protein
MADCIDSEPASQHLPPNNMNFQRNWAASVMMDLASCDPIATLRQVAIAATRATGLKAEQTRGIYKYIFSSMCSSIVTGFMAKLAIAQGVVEHY